MKTMNFKIYSLVIAVSAFLALSGCDSSSSTPAATPIPDAGTSSVAANPTNVAADGVDTSTVTVTVNDGNSDPITDATVSLAQTGSSTISAVTNEGGGTYTFTVTSTTPETVTYTATADGVVITQKANVTFDMTEAQCLLAEGGYETIVINGKTWLDRNLGAGEVATDVNDTAAFGNYYQFGRGADGHEDNESATCTDLADTIDPNQGNAWDGLFIKNTISRWDWVQNQVDNNGTERESLWDSPKIASNLNQVCPCGYIVPTAQDFADLNITQDSAAADTFKVAYAGSREYTEGNITGVSEYAIFWTSDQKAYRMAPAYDNDGGDNKKAYGLSIRCIKP